MASGFAPIVAARGLSGENAMGANALTEAERDGPANALKI